MIEQARPRYEFWQGRKVLLTGHTGFKGCWLSLWLARMGAEVAGVGLDPYSSPNLVSSLPLDRLGIEDRRADLRKPDEIAEIVSEIKPEVVFHLAAQSLVSTGYEDPVDTYLTNVMGTTHLLEAIRTDSSTRAIVVVTTDKVYLNHEWDYPYRENDELGGKDPYSASKAAAEVVAKSYLDSFLNQRKIALATARAGNVIGGGDWAKNRLIPDVIRAWSKGDSVVCRNPKAIRPWQHVLDPLRGYLVLAENIFSNPSISGAYNFGPDSSDTLEVEEVLAIASEIWPDNPGWNIQESGRFREAQLLRIDNSKSRNQLSVSPVWGSREAIERSIGWYLALQNGEDPLILCERDIDRFEVSL